jgi:hypothetical protein
MICSEPQEPPDELPHSPDGLTPAAHFADDVNNTFDDIGTTFEEQGMAGGARDSCSTHNAPATAYSGSESEASDGGGDEGSGDEERYGCSDDGDGNGKSGKSRIWECIATQPQSR